MTTQTATTKKPRKVWKHKPYTGVNNSFCDWKDVVTQFGGYSWQDGKQVPIENIPEPEKVLWADYNIDGYEGTAVVIWKDKGKYYFLCGSHCSCYGLEETGWSPEVFDNAKLFRKFLEKANYVYGMPNEVKDDLIKYLR